MREREAYIPHFTAQILVVCVGQWRGLEAPGAGRFMSGKQYSKARLGTISEGVGGIAPPSERLGH